MDIVGLERYLPVLKVDDVHCEHDPSVLGTKCEPPTLPLFVVNLVPARAEIQLRRRARTRM